MQTLRHSFFVFVTCLFISLPGVASSTLEKSVKNGAFTMDVAVNIVGVEAASQELSNAMKQVAHSIDNALQSDKLSASERQELMAVLTSFKDIKEKFAVSLSDARAPISDIVADANQQFSQSAHQLNEDIVVPVAFKFQLVFYIFMAVVVLIIVGIIVFIKVYVLGAINRASNSAQNLVSTIDNLPATVETIMTRVEAQKMNQRQPRFKRNISLK